MEGSNKSDNGPEGTEMEGEAGNGNIDSSIESNKESTSDNNEEESPPKRVVRHRRKGIPHRAPFF